MSFTLYSDVNCTVAVPGVSGSGPISTSGGVSTASFSVNWTPAAAATYHWIASYPGDTNNSGLHQHLRCHQRAGHHRQGNADDHHAGEPDTGTAGVAITPVKDTATFVGTTRVAPTGSVSFTLYSDVNCTVAVPGVSGSGPISTTGGVSTASFSVNWTPAAAATYHWIASYPGDTNNSAYTSTCGAANEQVTIAKATPTITTQASPTSGTAGVAIIPVKDTATFVGTTTWRPPGR